jgi:UDP-glucose 4-epimerase
VVELAEKGYEVLIADDLSNSLLDVKNSIASIIGFEPVTEVVDIGNPKELDPIFDRYKPDAVIHFAAFKAVGESVENPIEYYRNNISGLVSLLGSMNRFQVNRLIFSSSCTVYGETKDLPVKEDHPIQEAESPYGTTKIICEQIIDDLCRHSALKAVHLRYFNPVGAHPSAKIGELPLGIPNNLVPYICQTAAGIRDKLRVFGNNYDTRDGTCIRDYIHVSDLASAHVSALKHVEKMHEDRAVFNVGTGQGSTVLEVIRAFERANDIGLKWEFGPKREGDVEKIWADPTLANETLAWKSRYGIEEMMKHAWAWQQNLK